MNKSLALISCLIAFAAGAPEDLSCDFENGFESCRYLASSWSDAYIAAFNETSNPHLTGPQRHGVQGNANGRCLRRIAQLLCSHFYRNLLILSSTSRLLPALQSHGAASSRATPSYLATSALRSTTTPLGLHSEFKSARAHGVKIFITYWTVLYRNQHTANVDSWRHHEKTLQLNATPGMYRLTISGYVDRWTCGPRQPILSTRRMSKARSCRPRMRFRRARVILATL